MAFSSVRHFLTKYPLARGMLAYSITWPTGNIIQQTMDGKRWDTYDWTKCAQFAFYGSLYVAPTLYGWVKITSRIWPVSNVRTAVMKTALEQITYGPTLTASFFFIISLMERKTIEESKQEVQDKFWPTYKIGLCYWTFVQTFNYSLIPERNRVPIVSVFGLLWTTFLAYMKQKSAENTHNAAAMQSIDNKHSIHSKNVEIVKML